MDFKITCVLVLLTVACYGYPKNGAVGNSSQGGNRDTGDGASNTQVEYGGYSTGLVEFGDSPINWSRYRRLYGHGGCHNDTNAQYKFHRGPQRQGRHYRRQHKFDGFHHRPHRQKRIYTSRHYLRSRPHFRLFQGKIGNGFNGLIGYPSSHSRSHGRHYGHGRRHGLRRFYNSSNDQGNTHNEINVQGESINGTRRPVESRSVALEQDGLLRGSNGSNTSNGPHLQDRFHEDPNRTSGHGGDANSQN